ncbi:hypothetical protein [Carboxylicivirga sp. N1Y90]
MVHLLFLLLIISPLNDVDETVYSFSPPNDISIIEIIDFFDED